MAQDENRPDDELTRAVEDIFSHPDPNARMREIIREAEERREREAEELAERLRIQRENDPRYWKSRYEGLLRQIESEKQEKQRTRDTYIGIFIASAIFVAVIFIVDKFL